MAKCDEAILTARGTLGSLRFSPIKEDNKAYFVKKLETFINVRIDYILQFPGLAIPLKQLVE